MLLLARRHPLKDRHVPLPQYIRAPLSFADGAHVYLASIGHDPSQVVEVIATALSPEHWSDIWRLEIDFLDSVGRVHSLLRLLKDKGIHVLALETSTTNDGLLHTCSVICSCRNYRSDMDLDSKTRASNDFCDLTDLYEDICIDFLEELSFRDNTGPRVRIRRLSAYHRLHRLIERREIAFPTITTIRDRGLHLPEDFLKPFRVIPENISRSRRRQSSGYLPLVAMPMTDTKDRMLQILLYRDGTPTPCNITIILRNEVEAISRIFEILANHGFNVIRAQTRSSIDSLLKENLDEESNQYVEVDIVFTINGGRHRESDSLDKVVQILKIEPALTICDARIHPCVGCLTRRCQVYESP
jgi:acetolactate synthase regulatory subunit